MIIRQKAFKKTLEKLLVLEEIQQIKDYVQNLMNLINEKTTNIENTELVSFENTDTIEISTGFLIRELTQIHDSRTIERAKYYTNRLIKGISDVRTSKINDINLNRWKEYEDIITDSLWVINRRDNSGAHNAGYWGNFIPQIPNQFLRRYTKQGEWVLDTFLGSGTTLIESKRLGRNGIGFELQQAVADLAISNINREMNLLSKNVVTEVVVGDSTELDYKKILNDFGVVSVQFVIMHPPYWDIIKFSNDPRDLSNALDIDAFIEKMGIIADKVYEILENDRYCAIVIGDKYSGGEWIPLGFYTMQEFLRHGFTLKSTIIKNFEETKGKKNQQELWRYRALVGGFYIFKHEYIFLFKKGRKAK